MSILAHTRHRDLARALLAEVPSRATSVELAPGVLALLADDIAALSGHKAVAVARACVDPDVLAALAGDRRVTVRRVVAGNAHTPEQVRRSLVADAVRRNDKDMAQSLATYLAPADVLPLLDLLARCFTWPMFVARLVNSVADDHATAQDLVRSGHVLLVAALLASATGNEARLAELVDCAPAGVRADALASAAMSAPPLTPALWSALTATPGAVARLVDRLMDWHLPYGIAHRPIDGPVDSEVAVGLLDHPETATAGAAGAASVVAWLACQGIDGDTDVVAVSIGRCATRHLPHMRATDSTHQTVGHWTATVEWIVDHRPELVDAGLIEAVHAEWATSGKLDVARGLRLVSLDRARADVGADTMAWLIDLRPSRLGRFIVGEFLRNPHPGELTAWIGGVGTMQSDFESRKHRALHEIDWETRRQLGTVAGAELLDALGGDAFVSANPQVVAGAVGVLDDALGDDLSAWTIAMALLDDGWDNSLTSLAATVQALRAQA